MALKCPVFEHLTLLYLLSCEMKLIIVSSINHRQDCWTEMYESKSIVAALQNAVYR